MASALWLQWRLGLLVSDKLHYRMKDASCASWCSMQIVLLMRVLPSIEYMLRFFPLLESDGQESLRTRFVSLLVTQDGLSLPVSF